MSGQWQTVERRLLDLLADRATFGLTRREEEELLALRQALPDFDDLCMERAAATAQLAFAIVEPLPPAVHAKIRASVVGTLQSRHESDVEELAGCAVDVRPAVRACLGMLDQQIRDDNESRY